MKLAPSSRFTVPACKVYKLCEFCADCVWRVVSEGSKERMQSELRAAKRDRRGCKFSIALSMCMGIGDAINLPVPRR